MSLDDLTSAKKVRVGDGHDAALGSKADAQATDATSSWSVVSLLKGVYARLAGTLNVQLTGRSGTQPAGRQALTVDNTVKTLTPPVGAVRAWITVEGGEVRFTLDGTAPVASTTGTLLYVSDSLELESAAEIAGFKAIRDTATNATLQIRYGS